MWDSTHAHFRDTRKISTTNIWNRWLHNRFTLAHTCYKMGAVCWGGVGLGPMCGRAPSPPHTHIPTWRECECNVECQLWSISQCNFHMLWNVPNVPYITNYIALLTLWGSRIVRNTDIATHEQAKPPGGGATCNSGWQATLLQETRWIWIQINMLYTIPGLARGVIFILNTVPKYESWHETDRHRGYIRKHNC